MVGRREVLIGADQPWEGGLVEDPSRAGSDGVHVLFCSGNLYATADRAIGWASCETPLGPCHKPDDEPSLAPTGDKLGSGNNEVFRETEGQLRIVHHAWCGEVGYPDSIRAVHRLALDITAAGEPQLKR